MRQSDAPFPVQPDRVGPSHIRSHIRSSGGRARMIQSVPAGGSIMNAFAIAIIVSMLSAPLGAQWLDHPTPGIPRTGNGKPNLTAPAPRTADGKPDLSGLWQRISPKYYENITADLKPGEVQGIRAALGTPND